MKKRCTAVMIAASNWQLKKVVEKMVNKNNENLYLYDKMGN